MNSLDDARTWKEIDYLEARRIAGALTALGQRLDSIAPGVYELALVDWLHKDEPCGWLRVVVPDGVECTGTVTPDMLFYYGENVGAQTSAAAAATEAEDE